MSFQNLAKIFGVGLLGYEVLVGAITLGWALISPRSMIGFFDASLDTSLRFSVELLLYYFGGIGIVVAVVMLMSAWCILNLFRRRGEKA
jgi:hypothetical protein